MFVNFDNHLNMCDFYYPYIGKYNHLNGNKNGIGVRVDNKFSWIGKSWEINFKYEKLSLVSIIEATNIELGVKIIFKDTIHKQENILLKTIDVINLNPNPIDFHIYFYHRFNINESNIGNTAYYHPKLNGLIHYKDDSYIFISTENEFNYTTSKNSHSEGSWKSIENNHLEKRKIIQGEVDSAMEFHEKIETAKEFNYYIIAGESYNKISDLNLKVKKSSVKNMINESDIYWRAWVTEKSDISASIDIKLISLYYRSLLIVRSHIDKNGAIIAGNDTDIYEFNKDHYSYMWPRDGAFTAISLIYAGYSDSVKNFFRFCNRYISNDGFMLHKYTPDGNVGSSWHPWCDDDNNLQLSIQEDETALIVVAMYRYYEESKDIEFLNEMYNKLVVLASDFLVDYRDENTKLPLASYDLWEERRGVLTYTCSTVYSALKSASKLAKLMGDNIRALKYQEASYEVQQAILKNLYDAETKRFVRMIYQDKEGLWQKDLTIESSLAIISEMEVLEANDERVVSTMEQIINKLWIPTSVGGIARYEGDYYHQIDNNLAGNPWIVTTLWVANWYIDTHKIEKAIELLKWAESKKSQSGLLAEQFNPHTNEPLSITPLTWSHSSFCYTVQKLNKKLNNVPDLFW